MKAPDKLYIGRRNYGPLIGGWELQPFTSKEIESIEYIRKGALVEFLHKKLLESADRLDLDFHINQAYAEVLSKLTKCDTSNRAEEFAVRIHNTAIRKAEKDASKHGMSVLEEVSYVRNFKAGAITGYKQAEKDLGWHSVDESLPEETEYVTDNGCHQKWSKSVFAITTGNSVMVCWTKDGEFFCDKDFHFPVKVKYWMPMPKIPKEK